MELSKFLVIPVLTVLVHFSTALPSLATVDSFAGRENAVVPEEGDYPPELIPHVNDIVYPELPLTAARLQDAIDIAAAGPAARFRIVQVPQGAHAMGDTTIELPEGVILRGHGRRNNANLNWNHSVGGTDMIKITGNEAGIEGIKLQAQPCNANSVGIRAESVGNWWLRNVTVQCHGSGGFGKAGILLDNGISSRIENGYVLSFEDGILFENASNAMLVTGTEIQNNTVGIRFSDSGTFPACRGVSLVGNIIEGNETGIEVESDCIVNAMGNHFENLAGTGNANVRLSAGRYNGYGNVYQGGGVDHDIIRTAVGSQFVKADRSIGETFRTGIDYQAGRIRLLGFEERAGSSPVFYQGATAGSIVEEDPVEHRFFVDSTSDYEDGQCVRVREDFRVTRVDGYTESSTESLNIVIKTDPGQTGTDVLASDLTADSNGAEVTSGFGDDSIAADEWLCLEVRSVGAAGRYAGATISGVRE